VFGCSPTLGIRYYSASYNDCFALAAVLNLPDQPGDLVVVYSVCLSRGQQRAVFAAPFLIRNNAVPPIPFELRIPLFVVLGIAQHAEMLPVPGNPCIGILDREIWVSGCAIRSNEGQLVFIDDAGRR
jgi:hypothetical protein